MDIKIKKELIDIQGFKILRDAVGWSLPPDDAINRSLNNTEFCVVAYADHELAGMGRIIGDHGFVYFIADIIVKPDYQKKKLGYGIMKLIMEYLDENAPPNSYITLMAAKGKEEFYEKFGFFKRPTDEYGCGMMKILR